MENGSFFCLFRQKPKDKSGIVLACHHRGAKRCLSVCLSVHATTGTKNAVCLPLTQLCRTYSAHFLFVSYEYRTDIEERRGGGFGGDCSEQLGNVGGDDGYGRVGAEREDYDHVTCSLLFL